MKSIKVIASVKPIIIIIIIIYLKDDHRVTYSFNRAVGVNQRDKMLHELLRDKEPLHVLARPAQLEGKWVGLVQTVSGKDGKPLCTVSHVRANKENGAVMLKGQSKKERKKMKKEGGTYIHSVGSGPCDDLHEVTESLLINGVAHPQLPLPVGRVEDVLGGPRWTGAFRSHCSTLVCLEDRVQPLQTVGEGACYF